MLENKMENSEAENSRRRAPGLAGHVLYRTAEERLCNDVTCEQKGKGSEGATRVLPGGRTPQAVGTLSAENRGRNVPAMLRSGQKTGVPKNGRMEVGEAAEVMEESGAA